MELFWRVIKIILKEIYADFFSFYLYKIVFMIFPKILLLCLKFLQILNFEILKTPVKSLKQFLLIYFRGFLQELYQIYSPRIRTKIFNIPPIIIPTNNLAISVNFPFKNFSMFFFLKLLKDFLQSIFKEIWRNSHWKYLQKHFSRNQINGIYKNSLLQFENTSRNFFEDFSKKNLQYFFHETSLRVDPENFRRIPFWFPSKIPTRRRLILSKYMKNSSNKPFNLYRQQLKKTEIFFW